MGWQCFYICAIIKMSQKWNKGGASLNISKLKGKIAESGIQKKELAKQFGMSVQAINKKLSGKTKISTDDAEKFCTLLHIDDLTERAEIFLD